MIFVNLTLGEITLRTKGEHQLTGYAEKYLGKWGKRIMFFSVIFGIYSALLAYLIGESQSLAQIIPGDTPPIVFGIIFWIIMTFLLQKGIRTLKKVETWGVTLVIIIILSIFIRFSQFIKLENLMTFNPSQFTISIGVVMFALLGFTAIPELRKEIKGQEFLLKKAIIVGTTIPIILYILFTTVFVGVLGTKITQVATLSLGPITTILGIFTMLTAYLILSFSLKSTFRYDIKIGRIKNFIFTSIIPLTIFILTTQLKLVGFSLVIGIGGIISGGLTGILILLIAKKSKQTTRNGKSPEFQIPLNWILIIILSIIFISGIILEFSH